MTEFTRGAEVSASGSPPSRRTFLRLGAAGAAALGGIEEKPLVVK